MHKISFGSGRVPAIPGCETRLTCTRGVAQASLTMSSIFASLFLFLARSKFVVNSNMGMVKHSYFLAALFAGYTRKSVRGGQGGCTQHISEHQGGCMSLSAHSAFLFDVILIWLFCLSLKICFISLLHPPPSRSAYLYSIDLLQCVPDFYQLTKES